MNIRNIATRIGMDYEKALEDYCGDVTALSERLAAFPSQCHIEQLENAVKSGVAEDIRKEAKRIRKLAEKAGLATLSGKCHDLENAGTDGIQTGFSEVKTLCSEIIGIIGGNR